MGCNVFLFKVVSDTSDHIPYYWADLTCPTLFTPIRIKCHQAWSVRPALFCGTSLFLWGRFLSVRPVSFCEAGFFLWGHTHSVRQASFCGANLIMWGGPHSLSPDLRMWGQTSFCEASPHNVRPHSHCLSVSLNISTIICRFSKFLPHKSDFASELCSRTVCQPVMQSSQITYLNL